MSKIVEFEGPSSAKIFVVGEAPGSTEEYEMRPFVGGSGRLLNRLLMEVGLIRAECRIGNVMRIRPTGNNFKKFYVDSQMKIPTRELLDGIAYLKEDIKRVNPNVVLCLGNEALKALMGHRGISNWRGSVLFSKEVGCKILPTLHPANLMRAWDNVPLVMFDFKRLKEEAASGDYIVPTVDFCLAPNYDRVMNALHGLHTVDRVSFDVETDEDMHITAFALADSPSTAISIPFTIGDGKPYWKEEEEVEIWKEIRYLMEDEGVGKIAQNAQFDIIALRVNPYHIKVKGLVLDTMCAFHTVYPEMAAGSSELTGKSRLGGGKSLALLSSIYTRQPYYKHWGKSGNDMTFWRYNAMDACVTYEAALGIKREMEEFQVTDFYYKYVHPLIPILVEMQLRGVKIDQKVREEAKKHYTERAERMEGKLNAAVGRVVSVTSPKQMKELLYDDLSLPTKYKKGTIRVTTDEEAIKALAKQFPSPIFDLILDIRHSRKLLGNYIKNSADERIRCSYVIGGTETGRLSSRKSVFGTGTNLQNVPPGVCRRMFVADEGEIFISADLAQAEARVVAYLAEETRMIEVFERGEDIHQLTANTLPKDFVPSGSAYNNVKNPRRLFAKKHVHAFNYGEGAKAFATRGGIEYGLAKTIREGYFDNFPNLKAWHLKVEAQLNKSRTMITPLGRKRTFFGRWGAQLFREAYSFVPQSTVGDLLNLVIIRLNEDTNKSVWFMLQNHDAFIVQCGDHPIIKPAIIGQIRKAFDVPVMICGREMRIPIDVKIGRNWDEMEKVQER